MSNKIGYVKKRLLPTQGFSQCPKRGPDRPPPLPFLYPRRARPSPAPSPKSLFPQTGPIPHTPHRKLTPGPTSRGSFTKDRILRPQRSSRYPKSWFQQLPGSTFVTRHVYKAGRQPPTLLENGTKSRALLSAHLSGVSGTEVKTLESAQY